MINKIGRPKTFDNDEILKLAMFHFWEHGYDSSSLDDLLIAMNIKKSSFYSNFKSKKELFSKCLNLYKQESLNNLIKLKKEIGPKQTMLGLTTMTIKELQDTGKVKGCLLVNSGKECYKKYDDLSSQITKEFNLMQNLFIELIQEAKDKGEILNKKNSKILSAIYMNALNGLIVSIQAGASDELVNSVVNNLKEMLE